MNGLYDILLSVDNKLLRWFTTFIVMGIMGGLAFCVITTPFMLIGYPFISVIYGSLGCGIGVGFMTATALSLR